MNKNVIIAVLTAYVIVNDGSLSILTDYKTFNGCRVSDMDLNLVYIRDKDNKLHRIEFDDIIGIQFMDMKSMVGIK